MRSVQTLRIAIVLLMLSTGVPAASAAQDLEIRGPAGLEVFVVTDRGRLPLATLEPNGRATVSLKLVAAGKELEVLIETCDGKMVAVLVERGRRDEACDDTAPFSGRCKCVHPGVWLTWGKLQRLTISGTGQVAIEGARERGGAGWGVGWLIDGDVGLASLSDAGDTCDSARADLLSLGLVAACSSDTTVDTFGADVGVTFLRFIALKVGYLDIGRVSVRATGAAPPTTVAIDAHFGRARGVTFVGALRVPVGRLVPFAEAGVWRWTASSSASVAVTGPDPFSTSLSASDSGWDPIVSAGAEFWLLNNLGFSAGVRFVRLEATELAGVEDARGAERFRIVFVGLKFGRR